ncbi:Immunity protein 70 [Pedobacter westerhofensis]|uniref:Immunity protein 70 n=1 Tax=Pedobacter westerhofensis TaxID=425512 RepID=A0A521AG33_9SPHI|nr:Imm70 family immunity protein [Pedobacter westerhofensis]SMO33769.1 Immunity protein 70 [Pedobacter westerhofensis]
MAVGFFVDPVFYKVGTGDFLNSFFSTIFIRLENSSWGSKYPLIMNHLYSGLLESEEALNAKAELSSIKKNLEALSPADIIWDFEDLTSRPPWGDEISDDIKDLAHYFITSDGENLLDVLEKAIDTSLEIVEAVQIKSI